MAITTIAMLMGEPTENSKPGRNNEFTHDVHSHRYQHHHDHDGHRDDAVNDSAPVLDQLVIVLCRNAGGFDKVTSSLECTVHYLLC